MEFWKQIKTQKKLIITLLIRKTLRDPGKLMEGM